MSYNNINKIGQYVQLSYYNLLILPEVQMVQVLKIFFVIALNMLEMFCEQL